jgi:hypothetical protein
LVTMSRHCGDVATVKKQENFEEALEG